MAREASQPRPPERFWRLLKQGDSWNEYHGDPVRLVGAVVGLAVDHGVSLAWLLRLLDNPANAAAEPVRSGRVKLATIRRWYERSGSTQQREWCRDAWRQQLLELLHGVAVAGGGGGNRWGFLGHGRRRALF